MTENIKKISKEYPLLTSGLKEVNPCEYDLGIIMAYKSQIDEGLKPFLQHNPTDDGTVIDFVECKDEEDLNSCNILIDNMVAEFKKKYDGWDLASIIK